MAGGQERALRRRIRTIQSTKKITRAMELIAASQIARAQARLAAAAPYQQAMTFVAEQVADELGDQAGRFFGPVDEPRNLLVLAIVADRGLCGGYNANVLRALERILKGADQKGVDHRVFVCGRKGPPFLRFRGIHTERAFSGMSDRPGFADASAVAHAVSAPFFSEEVDQLLVVSTRYLSAGTQVVEARQLLPLPIGLGEKREDAQRKDGVGKSSSSSQQTASQGEQTSFGGYTEFEPDAKEIVSDVAARYVEAAVFQAMLEAAASEHTARQRAMAAATENADELTKTLTRVMNRARQDSITTEIMEIVGGAEALRKAPEEE